MMGSPQDFPPLFRTLLRWLLEYSEIETNSAEDRAKGQLLIWYATLSVFITLLMLISICVVSLTGNLTPEYGARNIALMLLGYLMGLAVIFPVARAGKVLLGAWLWLGVLAIVLCGIFIAAPSIYAPALPVMLVTLAVISGLMLPWRQSLMACFFLSVAGPAISLLAPTFVLPFSTALITSGLILLLNTMVTLQTALGRSREASTTRIDWLRDIDSRSLGHRLDRMNTQIAGRAHNVSQAAGDNLSPECRGEVEEILRLSATIGEELDSAVDRIELVEGRIEPSPSPIDPTHILHAVISRYNDHALERRLRFRCFAHPFLPQEVRIDSLLLRRAIMNVVDNAMRFTDDGGLVGIEALHIDKHRWIIEVNDSGRGIDDDQRTEIMKRLERGDTIADDTGEPKKGLTVAYEIVRILGGTMSIDSSEKNGTTVTMILPVRQGSSRL
jgi:signal transduction histidine kinase